MRWINIILSVGLVFMICMYKPISEKGTDEVFGILRYFHIIRENERVLVVHDLPISSNQRLSIEGSFTCGIGQAHTVISEKAELWLVVLTFE